MFKILQGKISSGGTGDIELVAEFYNIEDAIKHFNLIKEDTNGWSISRDAGQYLETWLTDQNDEVIEIHKF